MANAGLPVLSRSCSPVCGYHPGEYSRLGLCEKDPSEFVSGRGARRGSRVCGRPCLVRRASYSRKATDKPSVVQYSLKCRETLFPERMSPLCVSVCFFCCCRGETSASLGVVRWNEAHGGTARSEERRGERARGTGRRGYPEAAAAMQNMSTLTVI